MMTLIAAALLAAQPGPTNSQAPRPQQSAEHEGMDCCKECCKEKSQGHEGHDMHGMGGDQKQSAR